MYPLYINNGNEIKKKLQERKIYVPTLWPDVYKLCDKTETEYQMAENIIPIPVDQRYNVDDMKYIVNEIKITPIDTFTLSLAKKSLILFIVELFFEFFFLVIACNGKYMLSLATVLKYGSIFMDLLYKQTIIIHTMQK